MPDNKSPNISPGPVPHSADRAARIEPRTCSAAEAARAIGTGINRLRQYVREGKIRAVHHGRHIVVPISEITRFLEAGTEGPE